MGGSFSGTNTPSEPKGTKKEISRIIAHGAASSGLSIATPGNLRTEVGGVFLCPLARTALRSSAFLLCLLALQSSTLGLSLRCLVDSSVTVPAHCDCVVPRDVLQFSVVAPVQCASVVLPTDVLVSIALWFRLPRTPPYYLNHSLLQFSTTMKQAYIVSTKSTYHCVLRITLIL